MTLSADQIESLEFERKYLLPPSAVAAAAACLSTFCQKDARYPTGIVQSIYFDTPGLRLLQEKANSDLYKTKVRLRWYEDPATHLAGKFSFLEVKRRVGVRRLKWRREHELPGSLLGSMELSDPRLAAVVDEIEFDPSVAVAGLRPTVRVAYLRDRWRDPLTGARICLDRSIRAPKVNRRLLTGPTGGVLPVAVLEIKNSSGTVPPGLRFLAPLGAQIASFSKYSECFDAVARTAGTA
jgi:hypothetical protein